MAMFDAGMVKEMGGTGSGAFTLTGPVAGNRTFAAAGYAANDLVVYTAKDFVNNTFEHGIGTFDGTTGITRDFILYNSAGTAVAINFAAAPQVYEGEGAEKGVMWAFGDGSGGNVTISGSVTYTADVYNKNLTISGSGNGIVAAQFFCFVSQILDITGALANAIRNNGNAGGNASGATAGAAGTAKVSQTVGGGGTGATGATGGAGAGANGTAATSPSCANGGGSGDSAAGGTGLGGIVAGGTGQTGVVGLLPCEIRVPTIALFRGADQIRGGVGGNSGGAGGGSGANGGGGGGGGTGAGVCAIFARVINRSSSTAANALGARGSIGGAGGNSTGSNSGGGGGASGSGGGFLYLVYQYLVGTASTNTLAVSGGAGGNGGNGTGTGAGGQGGGNGGGGMIIVLDLGTGRGNQSLLPVAGGAVVAASGATGGTGRAVVDARLSL